MWMTDSTQMMESQNIGHIAKYQTVTKTASAQKNESKQADNAANASDNEGATVAISAEGLGLSQKNKDNDTSAQEAIERKIYQEMLESANEAAEAQKESYGDLVKALEIARRILDGDIVPAQDEKFLMDFNSEIYMRVKSMAQPKDDPKEYDTLLEEEEDDKSVDSIEEKGISE